MASALSGMREALWERRSWNPSSRRSSAAVRSAAQRQRSRLREASSRTSSTSKGRSTATPSARDAWTSTRSRGRCSTFRPSQTTAMRRNPATNEKARRSEPSRSHRPAPGYSVDRRIVARRWPHQLPRKGVVRPYGNELAHDPPRHTGAVARDNELVLESFHEHDPQVVALAKEADDLEALVHDLLAVGGRAMSAAQTTTDVAIVEKAFGDMTTTFTGELVRFGDEFEKKTTELLDDEDGTLPRCSGAVQEAAGGTPRRHLRPRQQAERSRALRAGDARRRRRPAEGRPRPDRPRQRREPARPLPQRDREGGREGDGEGQGGSRGAEDAVRGRGGPGRDVRADDEEGLRLRGRARDGARSRICQPHGDIAERVGGTPGARGKKGDFKLYVNPDDVAGQDVCVTVEAKNQQLDAPRHPEGARPLHRQPRSARRNRGLRQGRQCPATSRSSTTATGRWSSSTRLKRNDCAAPARRLGPLGRPPPAGGDRRFRRPRPDRLADRRCAAGAADARRSTAPDDVSQQDRRGEGHLGIARRRSRRRSRASRARSQPERRYPWRAVEAPARPPTPNRVSHRAQRASPLPAWPDPAWLTRWRSRVRPPLRATTGQRGGDLFIVDNSISGWTGLRYLEEWCELREELRHRHGFLRDRRRSSLSTASGRSSTRSGS